MKYVKINADGTSEVVFTDGAVGGSTTVLGNVAKTAYNKVCGYMKVDCRPTGGASNSYAEQIRMEIGATSGAFIGLDNETHLKATGTATVRGTQGVAVVDSTYTATGTTLIGTYGQVRADGTVAGSSFMAGLYGLVEEGGGAITASHVCSAWLDTHRDTAITGSYQLLYMTENGSCALDQVMYVRTPAAVAFAEFDTCSAFISSTAETGGTAKKIKITIDGVAHYINAYTG